MRPIQVFGACANKIAKTNNNKNINIVVISIVQFCYPVVALLVLVINLRNRFILLIRMQLYIERVAIAPNIDQSKNKPSNSTLTQTQMAYKWSDQKKLIHIHIKESKTMKQTFHLIVSNVS